MTGESELQLLAPCLEFHQELPAYSDSCGPLSRTYDLLNQLSNPSVPEIRKVLNFRYKFVSTMPRPESSLKDSLVKYALKRWHCYIRNIVSSFDCCCRDLRPHLQSRETVPSEALHHLVTTVTAHYQQYNPSMTLS